MSVDLSPRIRYVSVGRGRPLVLLHGFGMKPETYLPLARIVGEQARVVIPAIFELDGPWTFRRALTEIRMMLEDLEPEGGWTTTGCSTIRSCLRSTCTGCI